MKKGLTIILALLATFIFSSALSYQEIESRYKTFINDYLGDKSDPFISFVDSQLPYMALYRFYKIKIVGSIDRREAALNSSNFLAELLKPYIPSGQSAADIWGEESIRQTWEIESLCGGEEAPSGFNSFLGGFGQTNSEENGEKKLKECLKKVLDKYGKFPKVAENLDFNDLFAKALFLAYLESYLKHTNLTPSAAMASDSLSLVYSKYARYVTSEMKDAVKHILLYYSGIIDEPLPFKLSGVKYKKCERCGGFRYDGQDKLPYIEREYYYKGLTLKEVIKVSVNLLKNMKFENNEDFNWKIRMVAFFIYDDMLKKNLLGKPLYRPLKNNMLDILSHTIAYYLGATDVKPPIEIDMKRYQKSCGGDRCVYEMFRYSTTENLAKLFENKSVISIINQSLDKIRKSGVKDFERFSNDVTDDVIDALNLEDTKQDLAKIAAKAAPKKINLWWLRYVIYALLIYFGWKMRKIMAMTIVSVIIEILYMGILMDPISLGEGLLYSILGFFTFAFAFMLILGKIKTRWIELLIAALFVIFIFTPEFPNPSNLSMDKNTGILKSSFASLLKNDLYDGDKYRAFLKDPLIGFMSVSEFGRTIDKLLASKDPFKGSNYRKAVKLAEKIAKYSNDELRNDFKDFLNKRMKTNPKLQKIFIDIVNKYIGKPAKPPSVLNSQTERGLKAFVVLSFIFFLWTVGLRSKLIGMFSLALGIWLMFAPRVFFVEYGVPVLKASGAFFPASQILLVIFSLYIIFKKTSEGRLRE